MFEYNNVKINYKEYGNKKKDSIVYLHGWGQNIEMMEPIANPFIETNHLLIIDLPGFGASSEPTYPWDLVDFVEMIHALLEKLNIKNPSIVGHSFGGKLALLYASKYDTKKLVILAAPFVKSDKPISKKVLFLKKFKNIPVLNKVADKIKSHMGSTDYRNASPIMRSILVKHINEDIQEDIKKIKCPTLIIWGTNDTAVPVENAYLLEKLIKDSGVVIYENCTHYAYLERLNQTIEVLKSFFN